MSNETIIFWLLLTVLILIGTIVTIIEDWREILAWLDSKLTQIHAARIAYKRAKKIKF